MSSRARLPRFPWLDSLRVLRTPLWVALILCSPLWLSVGVSAAVGGFQDVPASESAPDPGALSPRALLATFLEHGRRWREHGEKADLEAAARAFEMESFPAQDRAYLRAKFASWLLFLLDRVEGVDPAEIPALGPALDAGRYVHRFTRANQPAVAIELEFKRLREGPWVISGSTLNRLEGWTQEYGRVAPLSAVARPAGFQEWVRATVPDSMRKRVLFLEAWQWIGMGALVLAGLLAQRVVSYFFARFVAHRSSAERIPVDAALLARVARPIALLATSLAFFAGVPLLDLGPSAYHFVNLLANVGLTIAIVWTAYRVVDVVAWVMAQRAARTEGKFDDMLVPLVRRTLKCVVIILGVVLIVTRMDRDLWGLVAGLSIGSLAVGFAAKDSIENLFGTFTVLMDKPFQLGDVIAVMGIEGAVEDVGFRSTRLRTAEDSLITVPNSRFISAHVENRGLRRRLRVRATLGLTYDTPPELLDTFCEGVRELIRRHPYTRKADYTIWMTGFGPSSLDLLLNFFLEVPDPATEQRERHRLYLDILRLADSLGVRFAYPTQTLQIERSAPRPAGTGPAGSGTGTGSGTSAATVERGRRAAGKIADRTLEFRDGKRPPPVRFDTLSADDAGHGPLGDSPSRE